MTFNVFGGTLNLTHVLSLTDGPHLLNREPHSTMRQWFT